MVKIHKDLEDIEDDIAIWRYMSLEKFLSFISK